MLPVEYRCFLLLVVAVSFTCVAAGCTQDKGGTTTAAASGAKLAGTPSPFALRSHQLIENLEVPATPARAPETPAAGEESPSYAQLYVNTNADPDQGGAPLTVSFEAEVEGGPPGLRYRWDFGDNSPPAHQLSVQHTYQSPGEYTARFTVTGPGVEDSDEVSIDVTEEAFDLSIEADPDIGKAPLTVQFAAVLDEDLLGPFYYQWDFGDGGRDVQNPTSHTYRTPGEYTATLIVTNGQGQSAKRDVEIQVDPHESDDAGS